MKIKLKEPPSLPNNILAWIFIFLFICILAFLLKARVSLPDDWQMELLTFLQTNRSAQLFVFALVLLVFLFIMCVVCAIRKSYERRNAPDYVSVLDFQPTAVILKGKQERALLYAETTLRWLIHIKKIQRKNSSVIKVTQVSLLFQSGGQEIRLEHLIDFEHLFGLLEQCRQFANFSYDFELHASGLEIPRYKEFVSEQIQNQLQYGVHLPFPPYKLLGTWIGTCLLAILSLFMVAQFNKENPFLYLFGLIFVVLVFEQGHELFRYSRAKRQLDKYRK